MTYAQKRAHASFRTRLFLHLANRHRRTGAEGFTLVELMIVVAVIGLLSAVALPNFIQARAAAAAGSAVGEAIGIAKECATFIASGGVSGQPGTVSNGPTVNCSSASASGSVVSRSFASGASGVRCLGATVASNATQVTINVSDVGQLTCS